MIQIDRMQVEDAGGQPTRLAQAILGQIPDVKPPIPIREIAAACDIYEIREEKLVGLEGGLICPPDKSEGAILVNSDRPEIRKRFTIGHELGHFLNPWHKARSPDGFRCSAKDLAAERFNPNDRAMKMEVEANQFSAEILLPNAQVRSFIRRHAGMDIEHIKSMASRFAVSRESAARRYVAKQDEPAAIVFSKSGFIRYVKKHQFFPALCVWSKDAVPEASLSGRSKLPVGQVSEWEDIEGEVWLRDPKRRRVCEQTLAQQNGFRLTLLALYDQGEDEDEGDDDEHWRPPTFRR